MLALGVLGWMAGILLVGFAVVRVLDEDVLALVSDWRGPLWVSLRVVAGAMLVATVLGIGAGYCLAKGRWRGRDTLESLGSIPLILPPTVLGYYLLQALADRSPASLAIEAVAGEPPLFTTTGCVIAAAVSAFPFVLRASRTAIEGVEPGFERAARALGLPEWRVAAVVTLPLAGRGIVVGLTLGTLRALGEFGATLMVGAAIRGETRTLAIAVTDERTYGGTQAVLGVLIVIAVLALAFLAWLQRGLS